MRPVRFATPFCLLLLCVPLYLWKVQGWWSGGGETPFTQPTTPIDPTLDCPSSSSNETSQTLGVDPIERLARTDAVELLRQSLMKYRESAKKYTCTLVMQERINGKLKEPETIDAWFKEEPFSVFMHWREGAGLACASLYVAGENDGQMCVRPSSTAAKLFGMVRRAPDSNDAKESSRYFITEFGLRCGTERTYKAWKALRDRGVTLQVEYLGLRKNVEEVGGRDCHVIKRLCNPPEEEGMTEITILIDAETWFQVGSILKVNDDLIGYYYFRDIKLKPNFEDNRFKPEMLKKY